MLYQKKNQMYEKARRFELYYGSLKNNTKEEII